MPKLLLYVLMQIIKYYMLNVRQGPNASGGDSPSVSSCWAKTKSNNPEKRFSRSLSILTHNNSYYEIKRGETIAMGSNGYNLETDCFCYWPCRQSKFDLSRVFAKLVKSSVRQSDRHKPYMLKISLINSFAIWDTTKFRYMFCVGPFECDTIFMSTYSL